jgi:hypothetical protein
LSLIKFIIIGTAELGVLARMLSESSPKKMLHLSKKNSISRVNIWTSPVHGSLESWNVKRYLKVWKICWALVVTFSEMLSKSETHLNITSSPIREACLGNADAFTKEEEICLSIAVNHIIMFDVSLMYTYIIK